MNGDLFINITGLTVVDGQAQGQCKHCKTTIALPLLYVAGGDSAS